MKIAVKLLVSAILSLSIGVAFASPLLVSELEIRPWVTHVQGPTAEFAVDAVYAKFTVLNSSKPVTAEDGPAIEYYVVLNITNTANIRAKLIDVNFIAAEKITNTTSMPFFTNSTSGTGYEVEGAWVDGIWYNVTYFDGYYPTVDRDGSIMEMPWQNDTVLKPHWIEGVQILDNYVNGILTKTFMNMNGTWTDVTGRIDFTRPEGTMPSSGVSVSNEVVGEMHIFQSILPNSTSTTYTITSANGTAITVREGNILSDTVYTLIGDGFFDSYWEPHESRLIVLQGTRQIVKPWADTKAIDALAAGSLTFQTRTFNAADRTRAADNRTAEDTWSYATQIKQVLLIQNGDTYLYNSVLGENEIFQTGPFGVEVFIKPRS